MDFYFIPPVKNLDLMQRGDRFFCLAQLYDKSPDYRQYFRSLIKRGEWVTLDNGAGDYDLVSVNKLIEITQDLQPSEVIPPDVLFDGQATIRLFHEFLTQLDYVSEENVEILACPQGQTKDEWLFVYKYFLQHPRVKTIGLSKITVPFVFLNQTDDKGIMQARHMCYDMLKREGLLTKPIHLLGAGDMNEFRYYKNDPLIRSNDSCNAIWSAMNGISFKEGNFTRIKTPRDYFDRDAYDTSLDLIHDNIDWVLAQK